MVVFADQEEEKRLDFLRKREEEELAQALSQKYGVEYVDLSLVAVNSDALRLIGQAGTGAFVDSSRCYHHGARVKRGERLILMFQFLPRVDLVQGGPYLRTAAFTERFGRDRVRELVIPNHE